MDYRIPDLRVFKCADAFLITGTIPFPEMPKTHTVLMSGPLFKEVGAVPTRVLLVRRGDDDYVVYTQAFYEVETVDFSSRVALERMLLDATGLYDGAYFNGAGAYGAAWNHYAKKIESLYVNAPQYFNQPPTLVVFPEDKAIEPLTYSYEVGVYELHVAKYQVTATSEVEAIRMILDDSSLCTLTDRQFIQIAEHYGMHRSNHRCLAADLVKNEVIEDDSAIIGGIKYIVRDYGAETL